jgi:uncharacterized protein (TIGR02646 family)
MPIVIRKENPPQLTHYQGYKTYLRRDFDYSCVYCTIHENEFGGFRSFHVEHFRPKGLPRFAHLIVTYSNLMYACCVCNSFKGNDWPTNSDEAIGKHDGKGYLDPCEYDYYEHFTVSTDFHIQGLSTTAQYMVERLHLDRKQLQKIRRHRSVEPRHYENIKYLYENTLRKQKDYLSTKSASQDKEQLEKDLALLQENFEKHIEKWHRRLEPMFDLDDYR